MNERTVRGVLPSQHLLMSYTKKSLLGPMILFNSSYSKATFGHCKPEWAKRFLEKYNHSFLVLAKKGPWTDMHTISLKPVHAPSRGYQRRETILIVLKRTMRCMDRVQKMKSMPPGFLPARLLRHSPISGGNAGWCWKWMRFLNHRGIQLHPLAGVLIAR